MESGYIHITVATICEKDGRFLMVEEFSNSLNRNVINQPAGHVELHESIIEAVKRETLEETAWEVEPKYIVGLYETSVDKPNKGTHYLRICFACDPVKQTKQKIDDEIITTHWLTAEEIYQLDNPRSEMVSKCVQDYLTGNHIPLDLITSLS